MTTATTFTFYYIYINTFKSQDDEEYKELFTFYYIYINTFAFLFN